MEISNKIISQNMKPDSLAELNKSPLKIGFKNPTFPLKKKKNEICE